MVARVAPRKQIQPSLFWLSGACPGEVTPLSGDVVIGRDDSACDLVLDSDLTSRRHARIVTDPQGNSLLTDLGSSNGTFVNGLPVTRALLAEGDRLSFGSKDEAHCVFRAAAPAPPEDAAAPPHFDASEAPTALRLAPSEAATEALSGGLRQCPSCRRFVTSNLGECSYCSAESGQSGTGAEGVAVDGTGSTTACGSCGAAAREGGNFCHCCGANLRR